MVTKLSSMLLCQSRAIRDDRVKNKCQTNVMSTVNSNGQESSINNAHHI